MGYNKKERGIPKNPPNGARNVSTTFINQNQEAPISYYNGVD
jgi:hypothetical protein